MISILKIATVNVPTGRLGTTLPLGIPDDGFGTGVAVLDGDDTIAVNLDAVNVAAKTAVAAEATTRAAAVTAETAARATAVTNEAATRATADTTLANAIANETTARVGETTALLASVNALSIVSVKAYGAIGDGVTNDTVALQAAIDAVKANGGCLYVPAGTYMFSNLNMTHINASFEATMTIRGDGPAASILAQTTPATGVAIDISGSNHLRFESLGLQCGPNSAIGVLAARLNDAPNCNFNTFVDFWIRGSASIAAFAGIAAESLHLERCWLDEGGPQVLYIGATNELGAVSAFGTIQAFSSNIDIHVVGTRISSSSAGVALVRLTDGAGVELRGCATYNTGGGELLAHVLVEDPNNLDGSIWPITITGHLFEGAGDCVLFREASHGNGALYMHFHITDSWCSVPGYAWVALDGTQIIHGDFVFERNNGPFPVTLQDVEQSIVSHFEVGATISIVGACNVNVIRGRAGGTSIPNAVCCDVSLFTPYGDFGKNFAQFGAANGQAGRYIRYVPSTSAPQAGQLAPGVFDVAQPPNWDPCAVGGTAPYPIFWDGVAWKLMLGA